MKPLPFRVIRGPFPFTDTIMKNLNPHIKRLIECLPVMAILACTPGALAANEAVKGDLGKQLDQYLSRIEKFGFSGSVLVAARGEVILSKGYGLADREMKIPFTSDTVSTIGSITKQFTAAAILKLEMQGKLRVEDPIGKYLPGAPEDKASITIHQLLTHSAGLRGDYGGRDSDPIPRDQLVKLVLETPLAATPGTRHQYSNEGYSLLGAIVERVSGRTYEHFLRENLFLPAGMSSTGYILPAWGKNQISQGYQEGRLWGRVTEKGWGEEGPGWYLKANGGIHSTAGDMYKWHLALAGESVLSKEAKEKFFQPFVREGPSADSHYAYGWAIFLTSRGTRLVAHNGGNGIFAADFRRYVDEDVMVFAMSNAEVSAIDVTQQLSAIVFGAEFSMPPEITRVEREVLTRYAGSYTFESGATIGIEADGRGLRVSGSDGEVFALLNSLSPPGGGRFAALEQRTRAVVLGSAAGEYGAVHAAFGGGMPLEEVARQEQGMWEQRRQRYGEFKGIDILGSGRGGPGTLVYVRMNFERGSQLARYGWDGDNLAGMRLMPRPPDVIFLPESAAGFVHFNIRQPQPLRISFEVDVSGAVKALMIDGRKAARASIP